MLFSCVYPGCFSRAKPLRLRSEKSRGDSPVKFHTFPVNDPERLKLWLIAIRWDVNTPKEKLYRRVLCSEHFNDETDVQGAAAFFEGVPQSTPVKPRNITKSNIEHSEDTETGVLLMLTSPEAVSSIRPSTSGTYIADEPAQSQSHSEELDMNISMLSLDCPSDKDTSCVPPSSTSTSTPTSEEDTETEMWKETKWIVNESNMRDLFKRCQECGSVIKETQKFTSGSLLQVKWECEKVHKWHWNSCADVRGMPLNNLLVSSSVLFEPTTQTFREDLVRRVLECRKDKQITFKDRSSHVTLPSLPANIATKPKPDKQEAILKHQSRF
uniref:THAP domain-containing protein 1 n=1 Tax=Sinocyclocheilus rhinocerous TaxID=307959 RepID=A0A673FP46_9TELE